MGRSLRRREARLQQGRAALLLSRVVGGRSDAAGPGQPGQVELAAEVLSKHYRAGWPGGEQLDDVEVRSVQSAVAEEIARQRHQASCVFAADHAGQPQGDQGIVRRNGGNESELQENPGIDEQFRGQRIPVVPGRRARLRQLHGAQSAGLIALSETDTKPRSVTPGLSASDCSGESGLAQCNSLYWTT